MSTKKRRGGRVTPSKSQATGAGAATIEATTSRLGIRSTRPVMPVLAPVLRPDAIRPGRQSPRREVPPSILRPPYAETGEPPAPRPSPVQTPEIIERMRAAGALAAEVLLLVGAEVAPGVTTGHRATIDAGAYPSPLNYRHFPKSLCTSVNEIICHGIPDDRALQDGDIVNVDITVYLDGVHGDTNATFLVGDVDAESKRLIKETRAAMFKGIEAVKPGRHLYDIGRAIQNSAERAKLGIVREFIGHGIAEDFHAGLQVLHYYDRRADTVLVPGMTFTIEPMITLGSPRLHLWDDDWTAVTNDASRCAQFEHTMVVTEDGVEILTVTADGRSAADVVLASL